MMLPSGQAKMATSNRKRGLELLIRKRGPGGESAFEIKVYRPDRAFLRMRPVRRADLRIDENTIEEADGTVHVLHLLDTGRHLRLSASEHAVWSRMDGRHSIQDLATTLVIEHGHFDFDEIRHTLGRLRGAGLIDERRPGLLRLRHTDTGVPVRSLARRIAELDVRWDKVDGLFSRLHRALWPLFSRPALPAAVLFGAVGVWQYAVGRWGPTQDLLHLPSWAWALLFFGLVPVFMVVHELAHGIACKARGRRVRAVGITMIDHLLPGVYVDVTDMYMASRGGRIVVALAGPLANLVVVAVMVLAADVVEQAAVDTVLWVGADANLALALYTLWPFWGVQEDGYDALCEALGQPRLRERSLAWLHARLRGEAPRQAITAGRALLYLGGVAITWLCVVAAACWWAWA